MVGILPACSFFLQAGALQYSRPDFSFHVLRPALPLSTNFVRNRLVPYNICVYLYGLCGSILLSFNSFASSALVIPRYPSLDSRLCVFGDASTVPVSREWPSQRSSWPGFQTTVHFSCAHLRATIAERHEGANTRAAVSRNRTQARSEVRLRQRS